MEGGEGAGKSTQAARLTERLVARGLEVVATREPGGSPRAEAIRTALLSGAVAPLGPTAEAMMFSAARIDHIDTKIRPALERGGFVICDRFLDSTRVYQGELGRVEPALITSLERVVVGDVMPHLTLILDLPPETGLARARRRRGMDVPSDRFEQEGAEFHERLRAAFLALGNREPERCRVIDGSQGTDQVADAIWTAVRLRFPQLSPESETTGAGHG